MQVPQLMVQEETQEQDSWCWAAVASSVSVYYTQSGNPRQWWQCKLAASELHPQSTNLNQYCPAGQNANDGTQSLDLYKPLTDIKHLQGQPRLQVEWDDIKREIDNGRPIGIHIAWDGGGDHYILVTGYDVIDGEYHIFTLDPHMGFGDHGYCLPQPSIPFVTFQGDGGYSSPHDPGAGSWRGTYFTQ
jgi:hypothetical protein